jgi:hypothetical protein
MIDRVVIGETVIMGDFDKMLNAVGGHCLRMGPGGSIEVLIKNADEGEWLFYAEAPLVQVTGTPSRTRRN